MHWCLKYVLFFTKHKGICLHMRSDLHFYIFDMLSCAWPILCLKWLFWIGFDPRTLRKYPEWTNGLQNVCSQFWLYWYMVNQNRDSLDCCWLVPDIAIYLLYCSCFCFCFLNEHNAPFFSDWISPFRILLFEFDSMHLIFKDKNLILNLL